MSILRRDMERIWHAVEVAVGANKGANAGTWDVENHGVPPDIEVEFDPAAVRAGHDPQLEKAVAVVMAALQKEPLARHQKPAYPNYHNGRHTERTGAGDGTSGQR